MYWNDHLLHHARLVCPLAKVPSETQFPHTRVWQNIPFRTGSVDTTGCRFDMYRPNAIGPGPVVFVKYTFLGHELKNIENVFVQRLATRLNIISIGTYSLNETKDFITKNAREFAIEIRDLQKADILETTDLFRYRDEVSKELGIEGGIPGDAYLFEPWFSKVFEKYGTYFFSNYKPDDRKRTIHLCGDSTMANKEDLFFPERGWGQAFYSIAPRDFTVINHAENGRSTKTFRTLGHFQTLIERVKANDTVIFQFGHNDAALNRPERYATPAEYRNNLLAFVREIKDMGATPILATPVARRHWVNGSFVPSHGEYPDAVKALAKAEGIQLLDIEAHTNAMVMDAGEEGSKELYLPDNSHFNKKGAHETAKIADNLLKELGIYGL